MKDKYLILYDKGCRHDFSKEGKESIHGLTAEEVLTITTMLDNLNVKYQVYVLDLSK